MTERLRAEGAGRGERRALVRHTVDVFRDTGKLVEKYDVTARRRAVSASMRCRRIWLANGVVAQVDGDYPSAAEGND